MRTFAKYVVFDSQSPKRFWQSVIALSGIALIGLMLFAPLKPAHASEWFEWKWHSLSQDCKGDCAVTIFAGPALTTSMADVFGINEHLVAPWNWDTGNGFFAGAVASRRIATIFRVIDIEPEIGIGQRFGKSDQTEFWAGIFVRWTAFPWNHFLKTTIAISTGLNYATGISVLERGRGGGARRQGSHLLHYLSPEITFALPTYPSREFVVRLHHRSGGQSLFGCLRLFNCVSGGEQFILAGLRFRF